MILFFIGFIAGGFLGIAFMALLQARKDDDERND